MSTDAKVWTVGALLAWTKDFLAAKGVESPLLDAQVLLAHALGCERIQLYVRSEEVADDAARAKFRAMVQRRVAGAPVAHLVGRKEFFKLNFEVTPDVLIPRPATETLVLAALDRLQGSRSPRVLDVGTGSGCIAVCVASRQKGAAVVAVDVSEAALVVARRNAAANAVADRIDFRQGDVFAPVAGETFDAVLSNPPYIPSADIAGLAADVRDYEPHLALNGGSDGYALIDRVLAGASSHLAPGGWLMIEVGIGQTDGTINRLSEIGGFVQEASLKDGDGIPRVVVARRRDT